MHRHSYSIQRGTLSANHDGSHGMDMDSLNASSLCSSVMAHREGSLSSGSRSSGSGILDDAGDDGDLSMEAGFPSGAFCFAFVDSLDERDVLCLGKVEDFLENDSRSGG